MDCGVSRDYSVAGRVGRVFEICIIGVFVVADTYRRVARTSRESTQGEERKGCEYVRVRKQGARGVGSGMESHRRHRQGSGR
jgi:hypothetical protein